MKVLDFKEVVGVFAYSDDNDRLISEALVGLLIDESIKVEIVGSGQDKYNFIEISGKGAYLSTILSVQRDITNLLNKLNLK